MVDNVVLAVGNSMMGDDGVGPLLAELMALTPVPGWAAVDGGSAPENHTHHVRELNPNRVVVVDAAELGLAPGEIRIVDDRNIAELFIMTTHNLPISFLIERLREDVPEVIFLGVQPGVVAFSFPMSDVVRTAVETIHSRLSSGEGVESFEQM